MSAANDGHPHLASDLKRTVFRGYPFCLLLLLQSLCQVRGCSFIDSLLRVILSILFHAEQLWTFIKYLLEDLEPCQRTQPHPDRSQGEAWINSVSSARDSETQSPFPAIS